MADCAIIKVGCPRREFYHFLVILFFLTALQLFDGYVFINMIRLGLKIFISETGGQPKFRKRSMEFIANRTSIFTLCGRI